MNSHKIKCRPYKPGLSFRYAQAKLDGIWLTVKDGRAYTSHPTDITEKLTHLEWWPRVEQMSRDCAIHGELCVAGMRASYVKSALAQRSSELEFVGFAIEGGIAPRRPELALPELEREFAQHRVPFAEFYHLPQDWIKKPEDLFTEWSECGWNGHGVEGIVFKNGNLLDWHKWKPTRTIDLVVTGITDGAGKYEGLPGSLVCSVIIEHGENHAITQEVANVSGMDDDTRELITSDDVGRVCEVAYQYVGSKARLRHPRFVRWRDDKEAHACTADQDPELEEALG